MTFFFFFIIFPRLRKLICLSVFLCHLCGNSHKPNRVLDVMPLKHSFAGKHVTSLRGLKRARLVVLRINCLYFVSEDFLEQYKGRRGRKVKD